MSNPTPRHQPTNPNAAHARSGITRRLADLTTGELLLVWAMRHWVSCLKAHTDPGPLLREGFGKAGIPEAVRPLDQLLTTTLSGARSPRDVRCPGCKGLGDGELDLLDAVAFAQMDRLGDLRRSLAGWLHPAAARAGVVLVHEIGCAMRNRRLIVFPQQVVGVHGPIAAPPGQMPEDAGATLH